MKILNIFNSIIWMSDFLLVQLSSDIFKYIKKSEIKNFIKRDFIGCDLTFSG